MARKNKATTGGRKKIAIERIASEEARHVCFSKRRNGVFTKATDLSTLCGAEVAVIVNSPAGNPYSFGSPGVSEVVNRFLSRNPMRNAEDVYRMSRIRELNAQCMELSRRLDEANAKKAEMERRVKEVVERNVYCKLAEESEGVGVRELRAVEEAMGGVRMPHWLRVLSID
ncbi:uncharacterized protein A4U43_C03F7730 [Asparagus officinalis]|uniref:MADS-box domain-containing protein n=1 Tax=Asparagus officinalis TaxID=4686 RepID=A0A5P1F8Y0_ASPOF|nr:agamous-like MADS-box protein AGL61 [Asparagus officinalis]ONK74564.1 uncharacterized protein A4U43_C03F7730 [Asparagus officinalis]